MSSSVEDLKVERERFVAFAFAAAEAFLETDSDGNILFSGGAMDHLLSSAEPLADGQNVFDFVAPDHVDFLKVIYQHLEHRVRMGPVPLAFGPSDDESTAVRLFALRMPGKAPRVFLSLRAAPLSYSSHEADMEPTGLVGKDQFLKMATQTMTSTKASMYMTVADVDGLEEAQKTLGDRDSGRMLNKIAAHLRALSIDGRSAGQIGDQQFAILHRDKNDGAVLEKSIAKVGEASGVTLKSTTATVARDEKLSEEEVIRSLSYVLNHFANDPNATDFESFADAYDDYVSSTEKRVAAMRHTIDSGFFDIAFQPIVSLKTGEINHHEVLARFQKHHGEEQPEQIIRFAEDLGMIGELDAAVFSKAVDYARKMRKLGGTLNLSVNLSGRSIDAGLTVGGLKDKLLAARDVAHTFLLEVTETRAIENIAGAETLFQELRALGYRICLDDFGSGASGYQYLRAFSVNFVKIDGAYVREMGSENYNPTFLMSIVRLCSDLGVKTVGEHVENRIQADFLKALGVDYGQGYFFGRPAQAPLQT